MKRLLSLTLALLMTVALFGVAGARNHAMAEEENPFVGLWEITGHQEGDTFTPYANDGNRAFLDFLPNGAIYGVMVSSSGARNEYLAYKVTGENTLDLYEGEDPVPSVYDPATGVITVTDPGSDFKTFVERVKEDPLPDIRALVDLSQEEQTYYGYLMSQSGQTINMLEVLPAMGMDPEDFYLTLEPDGTGYMQFGEEESGGEIIWTDTQITPKENPDEPADYTRVGDHILIDADGISVEFAPAGEVEVLVMLMGGVHVEETEPVEIDEADIVGEWKLLKATAMGQTLTAEQIKEQGLEMSFTFHADGTASMTSNGSVTDGLSWKVEGDELKLTMYSYDLFDMTYDGEYVILSMGAKLYFEKVD